MTSLALEPMRLTIIRPDGGAADFVQIAGEVDIRSARTLGLAARDLLDAGLAVTYVDLAGVTRLNSVLLGFLVQLCSGGGAGRTLVLCRASPSALGTICINGLDQILSMRPDLPPVWPGGEARRQVLS